MTESKVQTPRVEISKRLVMINSASSLVTRLLSISVLIWLQQYLLKRITPEEYSLLPVLYSVMMFAPLITVVLTGGLGRYIVEAYARGDDDRVTQIVSTMFPLLCMAGAAFLVAGWTFAWYIDDILSIAPEYVWDARIMMAMLMFSAAIRLPLSPFGVGLFVRQKFVFQNLIGLSIEIFRLALLFVLIFGLSTRVLWVVTASATAEALSLVVMTGVSLRLLPILRFRPSSIHRPIAKELLGFGGWNFVSSVADTIRTSADPIILNKLATPLDVTCFHVGSLVQRQLHSFVGTVLSPLLPALTAIHATAEIERLKNAHLRVGRLAMLGGLFVVLPLIVFRRPLVELYAGAQYLDASVVMALLLGQSIFYWGNALFPQIAVAIGRIRGLSLVSMLANLLNIVMTLVLVAHLQMGAIGSALATFLTATSAQVAFTFMAMRFLNIRCRQYWTETWLPGLAPASVALPVWITLVGTKYPVTWIHLGFEVAAGALVYASAVVLFSLKRVDRDDLIRVALGLRSVIRVRTAVTQQSI